MAPNEKHELERLFGAIADGDATAEQVAELEQTLLNRDDLQEHYAALVRTHLLLDREFAMSPAINDSVLPPAGLRGADAGVLAACPVNAGPVNTGGSSQQAGRQAFLAGALAASLLVSLGVGAWLSQSLPQLASSSSNAGMPGVSSDEGLLVQDNRTIERIEKLNRTGNLSRVVLPQTLSETDELTLCRGSVWMEHGPAHRERSYLLTLPPGQRVDVTVDALADCRNSLSVVELDREGRITGRTLSFANTEKLGSDEPEGAPDIIGQFTEVNDSQQTRYLLFSGSHYSIDAEKRRVWRDSDFRVHLEEQDVLVIGWDDQGYAAREDDSELAVAQADQETPPRRDRDYNDVRVMFRFSMPKLTPPPAEGVQVYPESELVASSSDLTGEEYAFDIRPGEDVLLMVSYDARYQNVMRVVDTETGQVLIRNRWPRNKQNPEAEQNVCFVRNGHDTVRRYVVQAQTNGAYRDETSTLGWRPLPYLVIADEHRRATIGYEDSQDSTNADWNDIRIDIHWFNRED